MMLRSLSLVLMLLAVSGGVVASEMTLTSEDKVAASDVIALGEIVEIRPGAIRYIKRYRERRQEVSVTFNQRGQFLDSNSGRRAGAFL